MIKNYLMCLLLLLLFVSCNTVAPFLPVQPDELGDGDSAYIITGCNSSVDIELYQQAVISFVREYPESDDIKDSEKSQVSILCDSEKASPRIKMPYVIKLEPGDYSFEKIFYASYLPKAIDETGTNLSVGRDFSGGTLSGHFKVKAGELLYIGRFNVVITSSSYFNGRSTTYSYSVFMANTLDSYTEDLKVILQAYPGLSDLRLTVVPES